MRVTAGNQGFAVGVVTGNRGFSVRVTAGNQGFAVGVVMGNRGFSVRVTAGNRGFFARVAADNQGFVVKGCCWQPCSLYFSALGESHIKVGLIT